MTIEAPSMTEPKPGELPVPDFLPSEDVIRLRRLLDRTLGVGFKLVVIEVPEPRERQTVLDWLRPQFAERHSATYAVDLVKLLGLRSEWKSGSANVWGELNQTIPPSDVADHHAAIVVWGFEELMDHSGHADWDLVRQFNIQRDLFVRDYPCWWVLLIHPASRHYWLNTAPDLSDFVALWIETPLRPFTHGGSAAVQRSSDTHSESSADLGRGRASWPESLRLAGSDIDGTRYDAALDRIHNFRTTTERTPATEHDFAIADLLEADVLVVWGQTEAARELLITRVHPVLLHLAASNPANAALLRDLSVSLNKLGDLAMTQGNLPAAQRLFGEDLRIAQHLATSDPANAEWQRDLSVSLGRLGDLAMAQGNLPEAQRLFGECHRTLQQLAASDLANAVWQFDLGISNERLGDVASAQGDLAKAHTHYSAKRNIIQRLAASDPANAAWQRDLSVSLNKLGELATAQGNLPKAQRLFGEALIIAQRLATSDPENAAWQRDLSVSLNKFGDLAMAQGNLPEAQRLFGEALRIRQRLAESDPANAAWQRDLSVSLIKLGDLATAQGNLPEAQRMFGEALRIRQLLAASDPANAAWQRDLFYSYSLLASKIFMPQERWSEALPLLQQSLAIAECLAAGDPSNVMWQKDVQISRRLVAQVRARVKSLDP